MAGWIMSYKNDNIKILLTQGAIDLLKAPSHYSKHGPCTRVFEVKLHRAIWFNSNFTLPGLILAKNVWPPLHALMRLASLDFQLNKASTNTSSTKSLTALPAELLLKITYDLDVLSSHVSNSQIAYSTSSSPLPNARPSFKCRSYSTITEAPHTFLAKHALVCVAENLSLAII
jgi:hypothetical protein